MKALVTGASGFLGNHLVRHLAAAGHQVTGAYCANETAFERADSLHLDFRDAGACAVVLRDLSPTHVIHAGAMTQTGQCEKDPLAASAANIDGTVNLLAACATSPAPPHFVFISTDLVYDGAKGWYAETDAPAPLMVYGRTKLEAENAVAQYEGKWAVIRSALIYGPLNPAHPSFLDWMVTGIRHGDSVLFDDEFRTPVLCSDLCAAIAAVCDRDATGLWHIGGGERRSRFEFGLLVAEAFGLAPEEVLRGSAAATPLACPRPRDVSLDITKARHGLGFHPTPAHEALARISRGAG